MLEDEAVKWNLSGPSPTRPAAQKLDPQVTGSVSVGLTRKFWFLPITTHGMSTHASASTFCSYRSQSACFRNADHERS
jgi:hypothetical protein